MSSGKCLRKLNIIVMGIKRNLVFDKMLTAFYSFQSFNVADKSQFFQPYIPLIKLQTYTNK